MSKILSILVVGVVLVGGLYFTWGGNGAENAAKEQADAFMASAFSNTNISETLPSSQPASAAAPQLENNANTIQEKFMKATLHTNQGDITIEFMGSDAPKTMENFTKLAKTGFYDATKFHRVIPGFMIQGGDPLTKDNTMADRWGTGGPGYKFEDEIHANNKNNVGTISMANSGPNTNGSQFFINVANNNFLDGKHTVFGRVIVGMDVVKKIESTETSGPDRPLEAMVIERVSLE